MKRTITLLLAALLLALPGLILAEQAPVNVSIAVGDDGGFFDAPSDEDDEDDEEESSQNNRTRAQAGSGTNNVNSQIVTIVLPNGQAPAPAQPTTPATPAESAPAQPVAPAPASAPATVQAPEAADVPVVVAEDDITMGVEDMLAERRDTPESTTSATSTASNQGSTYKKTGSADSATEDEADHQWIFGIHGLNGSLHDGENDHEWDGWNFGGGVYGEWISPWRFGVRAEFSLTNFEYIDEDFNLGHTPEFAVAGYPYSMALAWDHRLGVTYSFWNKGSFSSFGYGGLGITGNYFEYGQPENDDWDNDENIEGTHLNVAGYLFIGGGMRWTWDWFTIGFTGTWTPDWTIFAFTDSTGTATDRSFAPVRLPSWQSTFDIGFSF